jgi:glucose-1-phosphate adenylyltransferase
VLEDTGDDFGKDIIPQMIKNDGSVYVYDFDTHNRIADFAVRYNYGKRETYLAERTRDSSYWRDVGTVDAYYEANMDLIGIDPVFNLYGVKWPVRTFEVNAPPSKFVLGGSATNSIISKGCIVSAGTIRGSIISPNVVIERGSVVEDSVVFDNVIIEPRAHIKRAIIDKNVAIKAGAVVGFNAENDVQRGCTISQSGIVVVPKNSVIYSSN